MKKAALRVLRRRHANLLKPHEERFARTYRGVMRDLKAGVNFPSRPAALVRREWKGRAVEALRPVYRAAILAGGQSYLNSLTIRQKAASFYATKAARRTASVVVLSLEEQFEARLEETIDTTFDSLEEILDEAAADGLDAGEIDDLVNEEFDDILGDRTDSIATTETNGAINSVQDYLALQLAELQAWVTAEDDRVRPTHVIYGDAGAKPVGFDWAQLIPDAGYTLRYPCDPECHEPAEIVNCRCFTVPAGEVELSPSEMKDYLSDFEMDPEDILLSEDQEPVYVVNQYTGKTVKGDYANHPFRGNQYTDPGSTDETDREGVARRRLNEVRQMRVDDLVASGHSREGAAIRVSREQRENVAEDAVRSVLTDDLRHPKYRGNPSPYAGHCYVASEAVYHLLGGKTAGYVPQFVRHEGQPHWFLRSPDGRVIDPTRDQFKTPVPYDKAKGKGFLTSKPSARAARVLLRVRGKKAPFGRIVLKDFNPDQPRDDQGRWVDIFGGEQPSEAAPEAQTENATASGYAVDPDNAEQPQAAPPRMTDDEYNAKNEKWNEDADALAKTNKAKLEEIVTGLEGRIEPAKVALAAAEQRDTELRALIEPKEMMIADKAGAQFDKAAGQYADLEAQQKEVQAKIDALTSTENLTPEEIAKLPPEKEAEIKALGEESTRINEQMGKLQDHYLFNRYGNSYTWEEGRTHYVDRMGSEASDTANSLRDQTEMRAAADALEKAADQIPADKVTDGVGIGIDTNGRHNSVDALGTPDQMRAEAAYLRAKADAFEADNVAGNARTALNNIQSDISATKADLTRVQETAETQAIAAQGVDFIAEKCFRDDKFYHEVHERTSDEWQHIGGQGPATFRFASQMAFGLDEGGTFDSKAGRFITDLDDLDKTYPGAKDEATVQAGALRREYMETQAEISEGFTFNIAGDEDIDSDALSQMEQDAWNELGTSNKVDIIEGSKSLKEKALEWGMDNEDEVYKKAQEEDSASEPFAYEYVSTKEARDALADNEDAVAVIQKVNDFYAGRDTIEEDDTEDSMGDAMHAVERMQDQAASRERMTAEYVADRLGVGKTGSLLETIEGTIRDGERIMRADFASDEEAHKSPFYEDLKYLSEARQAIVDYKGGEAGKPIPDASKIAEYVVSVGKFERQWAQERISEFEGEVASNFDSNALRDAVGDDRWESGYDEARRDWLDPYYLQTYAEADPDNEIYGKFSEDYEPDVHPRTDPEEVTINADDWPHKLIRTVSADVSNYTPNYAESWAYDRQSFGSQTLEDEIDHAQILVFQGAKNWTTPAGQASMGSRENEFIVLSQPPKWVREARDRWEKVQQVQMRESQSAGKLAQRETLMQQYRELQRLQDFGTSEQHSAKLDEVQRLATALGLDWDTLVGMARKK